MKIFPAKAIELVSFLFVLICLFSCSKDTDLLADYVIAKSPEAYYVKNLAIDDSFIVSGTGSTTVDVLENDTFENAENVAITNVTNPTNGTVILNEDQTITFTPSDQIAQGANTTISDGFTYTTEVTNENNEVETQDASVKVSIGFGEVKAFPGAEGFAKSATGGRGGKVIEVTNLNDSGAGSLRAAIDDEATRTIVFKVSGYITLNTPLVIRKGNLTIAGQTAPGEGITLRIGSNNDMACLRIKTNNVIIRGLRFRPGLTKNNSINGDALALTSGNNIIFDHCSFSWATDELVNPFGAAKITFQNCIFSEGLMYASHIYTTDPNNDQYRSPHSMGMLIGGGSNEVTIYNSLFAHNNQRNPIVAGGTNFDLSFEFVNNIIYNWGAFGTVLNTEKNSDFGSSISMINNLHIPGNDSHTSRAPILVGDKVKIYAKGNINSYRENNGLPEYKAFAIKNAPYQTVVSQSSVTNSPFDFPLDSTSPITPEALIANISSNVGPFTKDSSDRRIISDLVNGTGNLIDKPSEVGGYQVMAQGTPFVDNDHDGMADSWEEENGLDSSDSNDGKADINNDGFTNLEDYLHYLTQ